MNRTVVTEPNVFSPVVRSSSISYESTSTMMLRSRASSRVRLIPGMRSIWQILLTSDDGWVVRAKPWQDDRMRIHLASDHVGFEVKNQLAEQLRQSGHEVVDHGPFRYDADDDYPVFCLRAAEAVAHSTSLGVVLGGSGNGEQISANKVRGIRAALAWSTETARLARQQRRASDLGWCANAPGGRHHPVRRHVRDDPILT